MLANDDINPTLYEALGSVGNALGVGAPLPILCLCGPTSPTGIMKLQLSKREVWQ